MALPAARITTQQEHGPPAGCARSWAKIAASARKLSVKNDQKPAAAVPIKKERKPGGRAFYSKMSKSQTARRGPFFARMRAHSGACTPPDLGNCGQHPPGRGLARRFGGAVPRQQARAGRCRRRRQARAPKHTTSGRMAGAKGEPRRARVRCNPQPAAALQTPATDQADGRQTARGKREQIPMNE